jgi:hypothetical protein
MTRERKLLNGDSYPFLLATPTAVYSNEHP